MHSTSDDQWFWWHLVIVCVSFPKLYLSRASSTTVSNESSWFFFFSFHDFRLLEFYLLFLLLGKRFTSHERQNVTIVSCNF